MVQNSRTLIGIPHPHARDGRIVVYREGKGNEYEAVSTAIDHGSIGGLSDDDHPQYLRESMVKTVLSADFAIDGVAVVTVTTAHGLSVTPDIQDVQLTVSESANGNVDDWAYGFVKVESVDATNVVAKINVTTASGTAGAKAKLNILVIVGV